MAFVLKTISKLNQLREKIFNSKRCGCVIYRSNPLLSAMEDNTDVAVACLVVRIGNVPTYTRGLLFQHFENSESSISITNNFGIRYFYRFVLAYRTKNVRYLLQNNFALD